jgi:hypothetical protein
MKKFLASLLLLSMQLASSSCVGVGYSSRGGWFIWPGGLGLLVVILVVFLLLRRR